MLRRKFLLSKIDNETYSPEYLTIEALEDGLVVNLSSNACEYCIDGDGNWKTLNANTNTEPINTRHTLSFRGTLTPTSSNGIGTFTISKKCNLKGNCMSMLYGDEAVNNNSVPNYAFQGLFQNVTTIISAKELQLPATSLNTYCYRNMFLGCTNLVSPPHELPATTAKSYCYYQMFAGCKALVSTPIMYLSTLASYCCQYMFNGCSKLATAPLLLPTICQTYCYAHMFQNCTSLVEAPQLPATRLADYCYYNMFNGCTKLTTATELPATTLASYCYDSMFRDCTSLVEAPQLPATTLSNGCYRYMFEGCTRLTTVPIILPATTLMASCYYNMFEGCINLTTAPELPATTLVTYCYRGMFYGCTKLTTAPELPATKLANYSYYYMFQNCSSLNKITMLATDISASSCLYKWVDGVALSGTFIKNAAMTSLPNGINGIPSGWTIQDYEGVYLISFTIDGIKYRAEEGMTWKEWIDSEYNTSGCYIYYSMVYASSGGYIVQDLTVINPLLSETDQNEIVNGCHYYEKFFDL